MFDWSNLFTIELKYVLTAWCLRKIENDIHATIRRKEMIFLTVDKDRSIQINTVIKGIRPHIIENKSDVLNILLADIILNVIPWMSGSKKEKIIS